MTVEDLGKFQLKRVNPFEGLIIDADAWRDAHDYHRNHLRLHLLAFHFNGIVQGFDVIASSPPDKSVTVQPGIGVDPQGNIIVVPQQQKYRLQTQKAGPVYIVIQFREVPGEPYQPPNSGQPTRMLDAYRIEERDKLPSEPYLELARIDYDPAGGAIQDTKGSLSPAKNTIDLRNRKTSAPAAIEKVTAPPPKKKEPVATEVAVLPQVEEMLVGFMAFGGADKALHTVGFQNLISKATRPGNLVIKLNEVTSFSQGLERYSLLYLTGTGRFDLDATQQESLAKFVQSGGTIFGEACSEGPDAGLSRGAKDFGLAFNQLAGQLKYKLEIVKRGHPLLSKLHVFSDVPPGAENGMLMAGGNVVYSGSDYGCAWQGGHQTEPLSREVIRASFEIGENILAYSHATKTGGQ
jgi:hypothetical protein